GGWTAVANGAGATRAGERVDDSIRSYLPDAVVVGVRDVQITRGIQSQGRGSIQQGAGSSASVTAQPFEGSARDGCDGAAGGRHFAHDVVVGIGDVHVSGLVEGHAVRTVEGGRGGRAGVPSEAEGTGSGHGGDGAVGVNLPDPVIEGIGDEQD